MNEPTEATPSGAPHVVRPGDQMSCPSGHRSAGFDSIPRELPAQYWLVRCTICGWVARLRPHFGDRPQDLCYVVEEEIPAEARRKYAAFLQGRERPPLGQCIVRGGPATTGEDT